MAREVTREPSNICKDGTGNGGWEATSQTWRSAEEEGGPDDKGDQLTVGHISVLQPQGEPGVGNTHSTRCSSSL